MNADIRKLALWALTEAQGDAGKAASQMEARVLASADLLRALVEGRIWAACFDAARQVKSEETEGGAA